MRRLLAAGVVVAVLGIAVGARPAGAQIIFDDRIDWAPRPQGTVGVLGDSVGYGLVVIGGLTSTLAANGWGPVRSYTLAGLHAAPEGAGDPHNVATWIGRYRAQGILPRAMVVVSGANDVGWPQGSSVVRNQQRIETAMAALGTTEVIWTTITHHNPAFEGAWNQALFNAAARWPNLHLCDWRTLARSQPGMLSNDQVHPTGTGYRAMRDQVVGCVNAFGGQARFLGAPGFGVIPASGPAGRLAAQTPARALDTREQAPHVAGGTARRVHVAPPGSSAAALNLTAVSAMGPGFLTAYPCDKPLPLASSLNYLGAAAVAAGVTVGVDPGGDVCVYSNIATHIVVDVQGVYRNTNNLGFAPATPTRLADSRNTGARVGPGTPLQVNVGGRGAWLNITAVDATNWGFLTAYPCGGAIPFVSNVNFSPGAQAVANAATVTANAGGNVCIFANVPVHVVVDLAGRFDTGGGQSFVPATPTRVLDTRNGTGGWQGSVRILQAVNRDLSAALPGASGVVATATAIVDRPAFVTAFPTGQPQPLASNLNPPPWTPTANAITLPGRNPSLLANGHGYHLLDVTGWWQ